MGLPWIRFDTSLPDNPKILLLCSVKDGHRAAFVYCCGLAYVGKHGTDGFIPTEALTRLNGRTPDAARLVDVGLWRSLPGGWEVHGWSEYNPSTDSSARTRSAKKAGSVKGNCVRWHGEECGCWKRGGDTLRALP
jgi:hypothetical protein